jgi:hypothetical protein
MEKPIGSARTILPVHFFAALVALDAIKIDLGCLPGTARFCELQHVATI